MNENPPEKRKGRPPKENKKGGIRVTLTQENIKRSKIASKALGCSVSQLIDDLLSAEFARADKHMELARIISRSGPCES